MTVLAWRLLTSKEKAILSFRPFLSGRDYHSMHHENGAFQFEPQIQGKRLVWHPYSGLPGIIALSNGEYLHQPDWYRNFLYEQERARGLDFTEDLAAPGLFRWDLARGEAVCILAAEGFENGLLTTDDSAEKLAADLRRVRASAAAEIFFTSGSLGGRLPGQTRRAVKRLSRVIPGLPIGDATRSLRCAVLCLATERFDDARDILLEWAGVVSEGMLPNRFPDQGDQPEYNSVDASLWYIIAVHDFLRSDERPRSEWSSQRQKKTLQQAVEAILTGYSQGTRFGIHMDQDGLLAAGVPGVQLTWMDSKIGDWVVTPRIGKPVEVQALWLNALWIASQFSERWKEPFARGRESFGARFWNEQGGYSLRRHRCRSSTRQSRCVVQAKPDFRNRRTPYLTHYRRTRQKESSRP